MILFKDFVLQGKTVLMFDYIMHTLELHVVCIFRVFEMCVQLEKVSGFSLLQTRFLFLKAFGAFSEK